MIAGQQSVGNIGDSGVLIFNRIPYLDIKYPIPHRVVGFDEKEGLNTSTDVIAQGLNFYESVAEITVKSTEATKPNLDEINELKKILMGGVIYNGSSS